MAAGVSVAFLAFMWIVVAIVGGVHDMAADPLNSGTALNTVLQFQVFREATLDIGVFSWNFPIPNLSYFGAWGSLMAWNSSLFDGDLNIVRALFFLVFAAAIGWALVTTLFAGRLAR